MQVLFARKELGFKSSVDIEEGLQRIIGWFLQDIQKG